MNKSKKIQIAIVWANPYNKNLGVAALAYSSLSLLSDVCDENGIDAEFTFFGSSRSDSDELIINNKTIKFNNLHGMDFSTIKSRIKLLFFPKRSKVNLFKAFDCVFDVSEGDSFTDIYGNERFKRILSTKIYFSKLRKPQVLLPQTIGPFNDKEHEAEAFKAMSKLDFIISRDQQSFNYTAKNFPAAKITESVDVAFYMPYTKVDFDKSKIKVGINVSGLLWNGGYTQNNQFKMQTDYKKLINDTLAFFTGLENVQVYLVPHVIPTDFAVEDDYAVSEQLATQYKNIIIAPRFKTPIEAKGYIAGLDFFTGARMHACIAAFSTGVPVYPMAYSRKFNGLFVDTLQYKWLGDCINKSTDIVFDNLIESFNQKEQLKEQISLSWANIISPRLKQLKVIVLNTLVK